MSEFELKSRSVVETLNNHVSIRKYTDKKIDDELLDTILNSARRSPTSSNMQAYSLVVVRDNEKKKQLAVLAGNQKHVETCDTFIAICADISRLDVAASIHNATLGKNLENVLVSSVDAALVGMSLSLAAESYGLGTVMIGGMRNHPREVAELLGFPKGVFVVFGLCIGWPEVIPPQKPRMAEKLIIHREEYQDVTQKDIEEYDLELAEHYRSEGRNTPDAAWTGVIANKFNKGRRPDLRKTLEGMGFVFD